MPDHNFTINGDEARILMVALIESKQLGPIGMTVNLWNKLNQISHVQPPKTKEESSNV